MLTQYAKTSGTTWSRRLTAAGAAVATVAATLLATGADAAAATPSGAAVIVAAEGSSTVVAIGPTGAQSIVADGLPRVPTGVAQAPNGDLYVSSMLSQEGGRDGTVYSFPSDGSSRSVLMPATMPTHLRMGADGALYILPWSGDSIERRSPSGVVTSIETRDLWLTDIAVDRVGNVYAPDRVTRKIFRFAPDGTRSVIDGSANINGRTFTTLDSAGNLYAGNADSITRYGIDGTRSPVDITGVSSISDVQFDAKGNMLIADYYAGKIFKRTPDGTVTELATGLSLPLSMFVPGSVAPAPYQVRPSISGDAPAGKVRTAYDFSYTATGYPAPAFAVTRGALPQGVSLDATTGQLTGTPMRSGTFRFTVTATNEFGTTASKTDTIRISR